MSEVQDLSHDIGNMTIYEKLARMQNEMHYIGFKKTGSNKFLKAKYFKLDDLLKELIPLTTKYETTLIFSFTSDEIKAHIHKKDSTIPITPVRINLTRRNMLKKKEIDEVESRAVFEWFKKQEKEAKA